MITFNIQANNGNYYRGHEPSNRSGNCWTDDISDALVFSIEQARELVKIWKWTSLSIVIAIESEPVPDEVFQKELFCAKGGNWYDYKQESA